MSEPALDRTVVRVDGFKADLGSVRDGFAFWYRVWKFWIQSRDRLDLIDRQNGINPPDKSTTRVLAEFVWLLAGFLLLCWALPS